MVIIDAADIYKCYGKIDYRSLKSLLTLGGESEFKIFIRSNFNHQNFKTMLEAEGYVVECCESRADIAITREVMKYEKGIIVARDRRYETKGFTTLGCEDNKLQEFLIL